MRPALLGTLGMLASPAMLLVALAEGFDPQREPTTAGSLLRLVFLAGWASSVVGLRQLRAGGRAGQVTLAVQLAGLALAASQELQDLLIDTPNRQGAPYVVADAAWPLSVLFMIVNGVLTARARVLAGWKRLAPVFCGLALPGAIVAALLTGRQSMQYTFPFLTTAAWLALGWAVRSSDDRAGGAP